MWFKLKTDPCDLLKHRAYRSSQDIQLYLRWFYVMKQNNIFISFMHSFLVFLLCQIIADKCVIVLNAACPRGRYGVQCRSFCTCANGGVCDPVNGTCRCGLGWTGQHCEKGEQAHKYTNNVISSMELHSNINRGKK